MMCGAAFGARLGDPAPCGRGRFCWGFKPRGDGRPLLGGLAETEAVPSRTVPDRAALLQPQQTSRPDRTALLHHHMASNA
jgi:hypothetical protein